MPRFSVAVLGGVVNHDIAALIDGDFFALAPLLGRAFGLRQVSLLGADVNLARRTDEVARMQLGLGSVARGLLADDLVRVEDDAHLLLGRVEFDQEGIPAISRGAHVNLAVAPLGQGEVARLLRGRLGRDVERLGLHVGERRLRQLHRGGERFALADRDAAGGRQRALHQPRGGRGLSYVLSECM